MPTSHGVLTLMRRIVNSQVFGEYLTHLEQSDDPTTVAQLKLSMKAYTELYQQAKKWRHIKKTE